MKPPKPPPYLLHFPPINPSKTHNFSPSPFLLVFIFFFLLQIPVATSLMRSQTPPVYSKHCNDVVPESPVEPTTPFSSPTANHLDFKIGYFTRWDSIFFHSDPATDVPNGAAFYAQYSHNTLYNNKTQIYKIQGKLGLQIPRSFSVSSSNEGHLNPRRGLRRKFRIRGPIIPVIGREMPSFSLSGYWSESTRRLCMVGSGISNGNAGKFRTFIVVLKLNYSSSFNGYGSLTSGILESLDSEHSLSYFERVSLLGIRWNFENYQFSLVENGKGSSCLSEVEDEEEEESLAISEANGGVCSVIVQRTIKFELDYGKDCDKVSCSSIIKDVKYVLSFMFFRQIKCVDKGKMQILLGFRKSSTARTVFSFDPNTTLIGEGAWDEKKNRVCGVACRVLNFKDSLTKASLGDCSIKFSLRYPRLLSRNRDSLVGKIWSDKSEDDPSYLGMIRFRSVWEVSPGFKSAQGLKYEYTEVDGASRSCVKKNISKHKGKTYPDGDSIYMRFEMFVMDSKGESAWGIVNPLFVGDQPYKHQPYGLLPVSTESAVRLSNNESRPLNISYEISYAYHSNNGPALSREVEISAEGIYDSHFGVLCMVGCKRLRYYNQILIKNDSLDCDIVVTVQFSPINAAEKDHVKGTIESKRAKSDPLYFGPINFSSESFYTRQAKESIGRMDLEISMVLISNTLACVFVGLQLFHVKKHPEVLPLSLFLLWGT